MLEIEMLREYKTPYKKNVDRLINSETFKNIRFLENQHFVGFHWEKLLENIILNFKKRKIGLGKFKIKM